MKHNKFSFVTFASILFIIFNILTSCVCNKSNKRTSCDAIPFTVYATHQHPLTGEQTVLILYANHSFQNFLPVSYGEQANIGIWSISNDTLKLSYRYSDIRLGKEYLMRKGKPYTRVQYYKIEDDAIVEVPRFFRHDYSERLFKCPYYD